MSTSTTWTVTGMTCAHCEASVREEVGEIPGVESVTADHTTGEVVVTSAEPVERSVVAAAVAEAGYELG
ncbi:MULTISPECIES: heavy-metal-associated domain-containing protein [unclassified Nocardioides]|uniref:heavy-metal-associated domain-containing protein n=1 Tax=unclassified Nocardioides TaxID=2615069 RepID=UPI0026654AB2|nr:heavy-metal-associated domain-containing protein [Nocardioides sp. Arc9.136]WKN48087.1 heavy-metal-associated domain-containing protein [Nocardioides sp. Arc9.136]